jgi:hypothetical protein
MILRAIFWVTLVSVLMPHEPDLGLGRPGTHALSSDALSWASSAVSQPTQMCRGREAACAEGLSFLDSLQSVAVHSLAQVKADIEAQQRARAVHG